MYQVNGFEDDNQCVEVSYHRISPLSERRPYRCELRQNAPTRNLTPRTNQERRTRHSYEEAVETADWAFVVSLRASSELPIPARAHIESDRIKLR